MEDVYRKLAGLGITLPAAPKPAAAYVPAVTAAGNLVFLSGQDCRKDGVLIHSGKVGAELTLEQGYETARQVMVNLLAVLHEYTGDLNRVKRIVKLLGFVNSAPGFNKQPFVINGASELLIELFGEDGRHARSALGTNELPFDTPVEIEMIVELIS
jgi:enamine deaminase RidA (YjgF/YER057c/UK114 family)